MGLIQLKVDSGFEVCKPLNRQGNPIGAVGWLILKGYRWNRRARWPGRPRGSGFWREARGGCVG